MKDLWFSNNDISGEVFSRLPTKTLVGFKCVSKEWRHLISDRSFIAHHLKRSEPLSGFFFQERYHWREDDIRTISYLPLKESTVLQREVFDFLPENVVLLAAINGLIFCRSCFPSAWQSLYVCNPLNKDLLKIRWPSPDKDDGLALAFDPFTDPIDQSTQFKLVRVHQNVTEDENDYFSFDTYSSRTRKWMRSKEICQCDHHLCKSKNILVGGNLFWLTGNGQILMFDTENELSWLIKAPLPHNDANPETCIGESQGKLHYVLISEHGLQVWVLEDYFDSTWSVKYVITLEEMEQENPKNVICIQGREADTLWTAPLGFRDDLLLIKVGRRVYLFNFQVRKMEQLCTLETLGPNSMYSPIVLPYTMSLVPL